MPKLIDMKSKKRQNETCGVSPAKQAYPWGLNITLENEALEKLGVNFASLSVGKKVKLVCEAEITSRSENENEDGKMNQSVSLQITRMVKPTIARNDRMNEGAGLLKRMRK